MYVVANFRGNGSNMVYTENAKGLLKKRVFQVAIVYFETISFLSDLQTQTLAKKKNRKL